MLAASFASPLIEKLGQRIIYYHSWGSSRSGKTATLLFAMSVWGKPQALMKTYTSTIVGMEHRAGMMMHLPLALDEIQSIDIMAAHEDQLFKAFEVDEQRIRNYCKRAEKIFVEKINQNKVETVRELEDAWYRYNGP